MCVVYVFISGCLHVCVQIHVHRHVCFLHVEARSCHQVPLSLCIFFQLKFCLYMYACVCICGGQRKTCGSCFFFHHVVLRDWSQVIRLGSRHLYLLGPPLLIFERGSLTSPKARQFACTGWPMSFRDRLSPPLILEFQVGCTLPSFSCEFSVPAACTAGAWLFSHLLSPTFCDFFFLLVSFNIAISLNFRI